MRKFMSFVLKLMGWDIEENSPVGVDQCVIVVGPHTSNWDFVLGRMAFVKYGIKPKILIKKSLFFFPLGLLMRALGGIPVNRTKNTNITDQAVELFKKHKQLYMVFTPEGTRSYNPNWKKGFYYIALKAKVPIYICYIDFENKRGGFHSLFNPTGDVDKDIAYIKGVLSNYKGKFPEHGIY